MISCGEPSGDLYAGALAVEIRRRQPDAAIFGLGGQRLMAGGGELLADYRGLSVTGLVEAIRVLPKSLSTFNRLVDAARTEKPQALVLIDFPDFNFRLAAAIKKLGVPIIYYISPQLWAWRQSRMKVMKRLVDRVLVIFPFEEQIYRDAGVPVQFVGHPLVDLARAQEPKDSFLREIGLDPERGRSWRCCPAAGPNEVERLLPIIRDRSRRSPRNCHGRNSSLHARPRSTIACFRATKWNGARPVEVLARTDDVLAISDVAITASGTATVQAALHGRPMVVVYRLSPLTYRLGRRFLLVDHVAMVNLIAGRRIVPELIQDDCTAENIAAETLSLLTNPIAPRKRAAGSMTCARSSASPARAGARRRRCWRLREEAKSR